MHGLFEVSPDFHIWDYLYLLMIKGASARVLIVRDPGAPK